MAKSKNNATEDDDDVVIVGDNTEEGGVESVEDDEGGGKKSKAKAQDGTDEEEDDEGEEEESDGTEARLGHAEDENEDKEGRRAERQERKRRQREARTRDKTELNFLRQRNEQLERQFSSAQVQTNQRLVGVEVTALDGRISDTKSRISQADQIIATAISKADGNTAAEAQSIRDTLREQLTQLEGRKAQVVQTARQEHQRHSQQGQQNQQQQPQVDPQVVNLGQSWMRKNSWYKPDRSDQDSAITGAIDDSLVREGFDPRDQDYWTELTRRVKRQLPHRFKASAKSTVDDDEDDEEEEAAPVKRSTGPRVAVGGRERVLKKNEVYISPERKEAMKEAGAWDDPVLRKKYLKRYRDWDRENASR